MHSYQQTAHRNAPLAHAYHRDFECMRAEAQSSGTGQHVVLELHKHRTLGFEVLVYRLPDETMDQHKVFYISFQTPHTSNNGLPHILEHLCMEGTREHPQGGLMWKVQEGALQSYLNAHTKLESTAYPVASTHREEFVNLTRLYLNAVFSPLLTRESFEREGWRIEHNEGQGPAVSGTVYQEMRRFYGDPMSRLYHAVNAELFKGSHLAVNSGGDPAYIPTLTHQELVDFHKQHYHPSRARMLVYCNSDQVLLQEVFSVIADKVRDRCPPDSQAAPAPRIRRIAPIIKDVTDPAVSGSSVAAVGWPIATPRNAEELCMWGIVERILLCDQSSPLRHRLVESKVASSVEPTCLIKNATESYFQVHAHVPEEVNATRFAEEVMSILRSFCESELSTDDVATVIQQCRFVLSESSGDGRPLGVLLAEEIMPLWSSGADPFACSDLCRSLAQIQDTVMQDPQILLEFIKQKLLDNQEMVAIRLMPSGGDHCTASTGAEAGLIEALTKQGNGETALSPDSVEAADNNHVAEASIAPLVLINPDSLPRQLPKAVESNLLSPQAPNVVVGRIASSRIVYAKLAFDLNTVPKEIRPYAQLVTRFLPNSKTGRELPELHRDIRRFTGGISSKIFRGGDSHQRVEKAALLIEGAAFKEESEKLLELMREVVLDSQHPTEEQFKRFVTNSLWGFEHGASALSACQEAQAAVSEKFAETSRLTEYQQIDFLKQLDSKLSQGRWGEILGDLRQFRALLTEQNLFVGWYSGQDMIDQGNALLREMLQAWPKSEHGGAPTGRSVFTKGKEEDHIYAPIGSISLGSCHVVPTEQMQNLRGAMCVLLRAITANYLVPETRGRGAAYGSILRYDPQLDVITGIISDVQQSAIQRSMTILKKLPDEASVVVNSLTEPRLQRLIVGTASAFGLGLYPQKISERDFHRFLLGISSESHGDLYRQIVGCTLEHLQQAAQVWCGSGDCYSVRVIGPEDALTGAVHKTGSRGP